MMTAFATADDLNTFTGRTIPEAQAEMMLAQATGLIRSYCGWHVAPERTETLTLDGNGAVILPLPTLHLVTVLSVTEDDEDLDEGDDYEWSAAGFLKRIGTWTTSLHGVVVRLTHGYDTDGEVPPEIASVCLQSAARAIANPSGVKAESAGGVSVTYMIPGGLNDMERMVLDRYRVTGRA